MRIALINVTKPAPGTIDIVTEYTYRLYEEYKKRKGDHVDIIYAIDETKGNNVSGLVYAQTVFKERVAKIANAGYDVVHVTNQEIGFVAKVLKRINPNLPIVTTVHDTLRLTKGQHRGVLQGVYNSIVRDNIEDSIEYSDALIFRTERTKEEIEKLYGKNRQSKVIPLGIKDEFISKPLHKTARRTVSVGYIGALAQYRNVMAVLEIAKRLKNTRFYVYGTGTEYSSLLNFKADNGLTNVELLGLVPDKKLVRTYDALDMFVYPGLQEDFANQVREAQSRGVPVIIFKSSKLSDELRDGCVEVRDVAGAARAINRLHDGGYGAMPRKRAMMHARGFTWKRAADTTLRMYEEMTHT